MIERKFGAVVLRAAVRQKRRCSCVVQMGIMQHSQTGESKQVRPLIIVGGRIPQLIDRQIVRVQLMEPQKIVRRSYDGGAFEGRSDRLIHEHVDEVVRLQRVDDLRAVCRYASTGRRHRAEPCEAGHASF